MISSTTFWGALSIFQNKENSACLGASASQCFFQTDELDFLVSWGMLDAGLALCTKALLSKTAVISLFAPREKLLHIPRWSICYFCHPLASGWKKRGGGVTYYIKSVVMQELSKRLHDSGRAWSQRSKRLWPCANVVVLAGSKIERQTGRRISQDTAGRDGPKTSVCDAEG